MDEYQISDIARRYAHEVRDELRAELERLRYDDADHIDRLERRLAELEVRLERTAAGLAEDIAAVGH